MASVPVVAVIGGGVSGLACANRLVELKTASGKAFDLILLEPHARLGGNIVTEKRDGFILENGPDSFLREKPWALDLAGRLGLQNEIIGTRNSHPKSFVVRNGKLLPIPEGFYLIGPSRILPFLRTPIFSFSGKLRMMSEVFIPRKNDEADESIGSFIRRRFGTECLDRVGQALLAGIYTGDPESLSLLATMPRFRDFEKKYGSVIRGLRQMKGKNRENLSKASGPRYSLFVSFKNGMQTFTDALAARIPGQSVRLNTAVRKISKDTMTGRWKIETEPGAEVQADAVCLTLPARQTTLLLKDSLPILSEKLSMLRYESVATLNIAYSTRDTAHVPDGFGFVSPRTEKKVMLACTFVDQKFENRAPEGKRLFRAFIGGAFGAAFLDKSDDELVQLVQREMRELLGITAKPLFWRLRRYPEAMVQYRVGHLDWLSGVRAETEKHPGLSLAGASYGGVGIPDCIRDAETHAEKIYMSLRG